MTWNDIIKNADEYLDALSKVYYEKGYRCPFSVSHTPSIFMCLPVRKLYEPYTFVGFMKASACRHDQSLTPFLNPFSFSEEEG